MSRLRSFSGIGTEGTTTLVLTHRYPISQKVIIKKTFAWLAGLIVCIILVLGMQQYDYVKGDDELRGSLAEAVQFMASLVGAVWLAKVVYVAMYTYCCYYAIEAGHLVLSKGVIVRQRGSFPLSRITDIYLDRTIGDFIFGLCTLHLSTPTSHSHKFAKIDGLRLSTAVALQEYLSGLLEAIEPSHLSSEQIDRRPVQLEIVSSTNPKHKIKPGGSGSATAKVFRAGEFHK